jgi:hypothetical protein
LRSGGEEEHEEERARSPLLLVILPDQLLVINPTAGSVIEIPSAMPGPLRITYLPCQKQIKIT